MTKNKVVLVVGILAYACEIARRYFAASAPLDLVIWTALGAFAFWKVATMPGKWAQNLGFFFVFIMAFQAYMLARFLKAKGDPHFWSLLPPMLAPLLVVTVCFFLLGRFSKADGGGDNG